MVNISIVASGSRGDVQPYVALGKGLKDAGHHVRVLASESFSGLVKGAGLEFCSTGESIEDIIQTDEWRKVTESGNFLKILAKMQSEMKERSGEVARNLVEMLKGSEMILAGAGILGTFAFAEKNKIPIVQAYVFPYTPTAEFPSPLVPNLPIGGVVNKLSFHVTRQMLWQSSKMSDSKVRKMIGAGGGSFWGPYKALARSDMPVLYGYSPSVLPRPKDWPQSHHVTGFWFLDAADDWTAPSDLVDFLKAGDPPVYIGFGSMGSRNPEAVAKIALEALERSGQRGILASGWGGLKATDVPETVHLISSIPHSWLFPKMAAVVHHGGVGTTAAGLRAGVPSIIVPFMGDQPFWGQRVAALGVGPQSIARKKVTGQQLGDAITEATANQVMRRKASELGQRIQAEDGVGQAVAAIQAAIQKKAA